MIKVIEVCVATTYPDNVDQVEHLATYRKTKESELNDAIKQGYEIIDISPIADDGILMMVYTVRLNTDEVKNV